MAFLRLLVLAVAFAGVLCQDCTDNSPDELSCPELVALGGGICSQEFITRDNYCAKSCGRDPCPAVNLDASQGSVTLIGKRTGEKTQADPATASVVVTPTPPPPAPTPPPPSPPPPAPAPAPQQTEVVEEDGQQTEAAEAVEAVEQDTDDGQQVQATEEEVEEVVVEEGPAVTEAAPVECKPPFDAINGDGELSFLKNALEGAGLAGTLSGFSGTIFAPTNAAFDNLLGLLNLSKDAFFAGNTEVVKQLLKIHVVPGGALSADEVNGSSRQLTSLLGGGPQILTVGGGSVTSPSGSTGRVAKTLNEGCPAIIHVIDNVIIPKPVSE